MQSFALPQQRRPTCFAFMNLGNSQSRDTQSSNLRGRGNRTTFGTDSFGTSCRRSSSEATFAWPLPEKVLGRIRGTLKREPLLYPLLALLNRDLIQRVYIPKGPPNPIPYKVKHMGYSMLSVPASPPLPPSCPLLRGSRVQGPCTSPPSSLNPKP